MLLLVGMGNPGPKYERNRHNIGFMAVDEIVRRHSFAAWRGRFQALTAEGHYGGEKIMAMKPTTFMNESGRAVGEAARFFKLAPEDVVVLHDELDLAFGKVRIKQGGGHAGHNGLRSIDAHLGNNYARIRLGIGHPGDKARVHGHVLSDFAKAEEADLSTLIDAIGDAAPMLANPEQHNAFMTKVALAIKPPPKKKKPKGAEENDDGI
ncbi:MAG: aminoacyl-tRNA hydrolase [Rhodospirillaceae bacterium]|nr:aminoacyl-tRNA hydrolase [Rhodospirillaceae bacterium]OUX26674.1 MAG: aminoacyl-tRNA hydrolase [Rhodospirillaceae bacterium TMED256]